MVQIIDYEYQSSSRLIDFIRRLWYNSYNEKQKILFLGISRKVN